MTDDRLIKTSPFEQCQMLLQLSLPPCYIQDISTGLHEQLNLMILRYSSKLQGVLLAYSKLRLVEPFGRIINETPYIHCKVIMDALVFQPKIGSTIEGVVNKVGSNHVGLLVAGVFNASISSAQLPTDYSYDYVNTQWINNSCSIDDESRHLEVGSTVVFTVNKLHTASEVMSIEGSLVVPEQSSSPVNNHDDDDAFSLKKKKSTSKKSKSKSKRKDRTTDDDSIETTTDLPKKKKKKMKH